MWGVDAGVRDVRRDDRIARLAAAGSSGRGGPTFEHTQGGEGRSDPDIAPRGKKTRNISHRLRFYRLPMCSFASFELFDHDGPVGIELHCSRRSPSKLTISFTLSERTLFGQTPHAATMKVCSLDQQPLSIKIKRTGARTLRPVAIVLSGSRMRQSEHQYIFFDICSVQYTRHPTILQDASCQICQWSLEAEPL